MAQGNVEVWLGALLKMAMQSVHAVIKQAAIAIDDPNFDLMELLRTYPAQVITLTSLLYLNDMMCVIRSAC